MARQRVRVPWLATAFALLNALAASAAIEVSDAAFRPDRELPEYNAFWNAMYQWGDALVPRSGGAVAIHLRDTGFGTVRADGRLVDHAVLPLSVCCRADAIRRLAPPRVSSLCSSGFWEDVN